MTGKYLSGAGVDEERKLHHHFFLFLNGVDATKGGVNCFKGIIPQKHMFRSYDCVKNCLPLRGSPLNFLEHAISKRQAGNLYNHFDFRPRYNEQYYSPSHWSVSFIYRALPYTGGRGFCFGNFLLSFSLTLPLHLSATSLTRKAIVDNKNVPQRRWFCPTVCSFQRKVVSWLPQQRRRTPKKIITIILFIIHILLYKRCCWEVFALGSQCRPLQLSQWQRKMNAFLNTRKHTNTEEKGNE